MACVSLRGQELRTTTNNLAYRLERGDVPDPSAVVPAPVETQRALRIARGGEQLLQLCEGHPDRWKKDSLLFRLAHRDAGSTIACRERSSPSLHMVFYERPGGGREAWLHFDLHGPSHVFGHATEVLRNRMTLGLTSEYEVYRGLVRAAGEAAPPPRYDVAAHARKYLHDSFGPQAAMVAAASAAGSYSFRAIAERNTGPARFTDRVSTNVARNAVRASIEFGASAFLEQDLAFAPSGESGFRRRATSALYRTLFVPGREGHELAFPRLAAAFGTPWALRPWHPGRVSPPNPWVESAFLMARYAARSFWAEFRPDITRVVQKVLRRAPEQIAPPLPAPGD